MLPLGSHEAKERGIQKKAKSKSVNHKEYTEEIVTRVLWCRTLNGLRKMTCEVVNINLSGLAYSGLLYSALGENFGTPCIL